MAACMSEMLASNTANAGAFAVWRASGLVAWLPVTRSRTNRLTVYLMCQRISRTSSPGHETLQSAADAVLSRTTEFVRRLTCDDSLRDRGYRCAPCVC